jgi:GT2 family glycosyltransferase
MMQEPGAAAVVLVDYNGLRDTLKCLESLRAADLRGAKVIVVDNGSTPPTAPEIAAAHPWATVIRREKNGGWAGGNNEGIRRALSRGARQVILLNNDTTVAPDLVERLLAAARAAPRFGVIGPVINAMDAAEEVMTDGCVFNAPDVSGSFFYRKVVPLARGAIPVVTEVDIVNGCCMMVSAEVFRRAGLVDERFFLVHEESDLCLRARRAGFRCGVIGEALVRHKGSSSFQRTGRRHQRYYDARNLYLLIRKHAATHDRGRGPLRSRLEWLRYAYYRYSHEREDGKEDAANAVLEGVLDAVAGRFGAFAPRPRPALPLVRALFETARLWRKGRREAARAAPLR